MSRSRLSLAGMRIAYFTPRSSRLEGRRIGRARLDLDRLAMVRDRLSGMSLTTVANQYGISRALVCRLVNESKAPVVELIR